jgi:hypothetical protein
MYQQLLILKRFLKKGIGSVWSAKVVTFGDANFNQTIDQSTRHLPIDLEESC